MSKHYIPDAYERCEITFQTLDCETPHFWVNIVIEDDSDMYAFIRVPLEKLIEAVEWCTPYEYKVYTE